MSKLKQLLIPITLIIVLLQTSAVYAFTDIDEGDGYYVEISYLEEQGIIDGYPDGSFKPNQEINRAEALKMLTLASGQYTEEDFDNADSEEAFTDTPEDAWYTKYLVLAKENGIIDGYEDGSFQPGKNINLAETLKIYIESYPNIIYPNIEDYIFADSALDDWYSKYIAYAAARDMLQIYPSNSIYPAQDMTRGYMASLIYKKKKSSEGYRFGKATFYGAAVQGHYTASGEIFDMYQMTAAHKTLPFGTVVEVTNLANGKSVEVRITDRGPYGPGRVIDLTSGAFKEIASLGTGVIHVQYRVVSTPE